MRTLILPGLVYVEEFLIQKQLVHGLSTDTSFFCLADLCDHFHVLMRSLGNIWPGCIQGPRTVPERRDRAESHVGETLYPLHIYHVQLFTDCSQ